jgi:hypothetical protein
MSDRFDTWVTVIPPVGQVKETAAELLRLAGDPRDVRTLGNGDEFLVPPELADAYNTPAPKPAAAPKPRSRAKKEAN